LSTRQQGIIPIAAYTANGDLESLKAAIRGGFDAGLSVNEIKEIQIHLYAYVGFPRALNGLATLLTVVEERKAAGITDPVGEEANALPADKSPLDLGKSVQTQLAGRPVSGPLFDFAPAINSFLQSHLFGDLFGRGILNYQSREIATLSALANIAGVESQLEVHVGIATNVGLTEAQLSALAAVLNQRVGMQAGHRAEQALQAVLPERAEG
jgi:4-carboxymuconolactone decarboxylase